jgi:ADP-heptose:LPS heptosyltransferase
VEGCDVLAHHGPVGPFAALAGASDLYVGYDSGFQHIAAAQGVPVVDVFVNPPNALFPMRWRPHSTAPAIAVRIADDPAGYRTGLGNVLDACRRIRGASAAAG